MSFEELVNKFNGDKDAALKTLANAEFTKKFEVVGGAENSEALVNGLNEEDAIKYMDYLFQEVNADKEFSKRFYKDLKKNFTKSMFLNLTVDEVKAAKKNPFKAKVMKGILAMVISGALFVAAGVFLPGVSTIVAVPAIKAVMGVLTSTIFMSTGLDLARYIVFKNFKKELEQDDIEHDLNRYQSKEEKGAHL